MITLQDILDGAQLLDARNDLELAAALKALANEWHRRQFGYPAKFASGEFEPTGCFWLSNHFCAVCLMFR